MIEIILTCFHDLPPEFVAAFLAALPVIETRVALPVAIFVLHLSPMAAFFLHYLGIFCRFHLFYAPYSHSPRDSSSDSRLDQWFVAWREKQEKSLGELFEVGARSSSFSW